MIRRRRSSLARSVAAPIVVVRTRFFLPASFVGSRNQSTGCMGSFFLVLAVFVGAWHWGLSPINAVIEAPTRLWDAAFGPMQGLGTLPYMMLIVSMTLIQFIALFWF